MEKLVLRYNSLLSVIVDSCLGLSDFTLLELRYCLSVIKSDIDSLGYLLVYDDDGFIVDYRRVDDSVYSLDYVFVSKMLNHHLYRSFYVDLNGIREKSFILKSIDTSLLDSEELEMFKKGFVKFCYVYKYRRSQRRNFVKKDVKPVKLKRVRCNVEYIPVNVDEFIKSM